jgi:hypothetical protein
MSQLSATVFLIRGLAFAYICGGIKVIHPLIITTRSLRFNRGSSHPIAMGNQSGGILLDMIALIETCWPIVALSQSWIKMGVSFI